MARSNTGVPKRVSSAVARRAFRVSIFGDVISELGRVTWPTRQETMRLTIMVIAVSAVIGAFLGLVDLSFTRLFERIILGN